MKTKRFHRWVAFVLTLVMLLPMITVPTFSDAPGGIAYPKDAVWFEDFEDASAPSDVCKSYPSLSSISASLTDSEDSVFTLPIKADASVAPYLWIDKNTRSVLKDYTTGEDGKVTGTATLGGLTYNVTGVVNTTGTTTAATVNSCSGTAKTVYIVSGEYADAIGGVSNIAKGAYFKNPAWTNDSVDAFVIDMQVYLSSDAKGVIATQITGKKLADGATRYMQPFKLTANGSSATLGLGDNGEKTAGDTKTLALGRWHRLTVVFDKDTSAMDIYANGVYAFTAEMKTSSNNYTKVSGPVDIVKESFLVQVNRGSLPANLVGTLQVDDISFYNSTKGLGLFMYGTDLEAYENMHGQRPTSAEGFADTPNTAVFAEDPTNPDNTVLKVEVRGNFDPELKRNYAYQSDSVYYPITDGKVTVNNVEYTPSSTTVGDTNVTLTAADGSTLTGVYQIWTHEQLDVRLGNKNIGVAATPTTKAISYTTTPKIVTETRYYLSEDMKGILEIQGYGGAWLNCFVIDARYTTATVSKHTSGMTVLSGGSVNVNRGEWFTVHLVWDLVSGQQEVYVNGQFAFVQNYTTAKSNISISANCWYPVKIQRRQAAQGVLYADDLKIYDAEQFLEEGVLDVPSYAEDFEDYKSSVGSAATLGVSATKTATYEKDPADASNTVVKIPFAPLKDSTEILMRMNGSVPVEKGWYAVTRNAETNAVEVAGYTVTEEDGGTYTITDGTDTYTGLKLTTKDAYCAYWGGDGVIDNNWKLNHPALSFITGQFVEISANYYLSEDAKGEFQVQVHNLAKAGATASWQYLFCVNATTGAIGIGGNMDHEVLKKGEWNSVSLVLNLASGAGTLYVNGAYVDATDFGENIVISAKNINFAKIPRKSNYYASFAGYVMVDDFSVGVMKNQTVEIEADKLMYVDVNGDRLYTNRFFLPAGMTYTAKYFDETSYEGMMTTEKAASVRVTSPSGLRFATKLDAEKLDALFALKDAGEIENVIFGTIIAPSAFITTDFTKEAFEEEGKKILTVTATHDKYYAFDNDASTTHFVGSIVNMYMANITREFAGRGFATVTFKTGQTYSLYSDTYHTTSVQSVAQSALDDTTVTWGDDALEILESFAAGEAAPDAPKEQELNGLNVLAMGDSLFQGAANDDGEYQWINVMGREYNWNLTNLGIGGATISYQPAKNLSNVSIYNLLFNHPENYCYGSTADERYYNTGNPSGVKADVDIILLQAGSNDYGHTAQAPLGTIGSTDPSTFLGAWKLVVDRLLVEYPNATVVMMTAWENGNQTRDDGAKAIPFTSSVVDLYEQLYSNNSRVRLIDSGDPDVSNVHMLDTAWRTQYSFDSFHLTNEGMEIMKDAMAPYLQKIAYSIRLQRMEDLKDTNVLAIGDSLFGGHTLADGEQWLEILAKQGDWNLTNLGQNGWTVAYNPGAYADPAQVRPSMHHYLMNQSSTYCFGSTTRGYTVGDTANKTAADVDLI